MRFWSKDSCRSVLASEGTNEERASTTPCGLILRPWENGQNGLEKSMSVELISVLSAVLAIGATLTGVIPDSATSTVASEMPASSASSRSPLSQLANCTSSCGPSTGQP